MDPPNRQTAVWSSYWLPRWDPKPSEFGEVFQPTNFRDVNVMEFLCQPQVAKKNAPIFWWKKKQKNPNPRKLRVNPGRLATHPSGLGHSEVQSFDALGGQQLMAYDLVAEIQRS